jgi:hypothetical protein
MARLFSKDPCLRYALALGYQLTPGRKHWHAHHPNGGRTIIPFGRKRSTRSERNILASLARACRPLSP